MPDVHDPHGTLTLPTTREILTVLADGKRQTPINVAAILDRDRNYMSQQLRDLESRGFVHDPGPAERSGMYELTDLGRIAAERIDRYVRDYHDQWLDVITRAHNTQPDDEYVPRLLALTDDEYTALQIVTVTHTEHGQDYAFHTNVAETARNEFDVELSPDVAGTHLYRLYVNLLLDREQNIDAYRLNTRGTIVARHDREYVLNNPIELSKQLNEAENTIL